LRSGALGWGISREWRESYDDWTEVEARLTILFRFEGLGMDPILQEIVERLVARFRPSRVYLFGSRARGEATLDSDYDVLMVVADSATPAHRREMDACDALWGVPAAVDVLVWSESEFQKRLGARASLPATVVREGVLLHAA
jgi:predicted nucleotidyltransferase